MDRVSKSYDGWYKGWPTKKVIVFYWSVWKYFDYPLEKEVRMERVAIEPERRFHRFIWETIVSDVQNNQDIISR